MSYYRKKVYDSHNGDSKLNARTGQVVEVLRELTDREADIADVGRMFHVRFADGFETDAFEDELEVHDGVKTIVDEHHSFQVVDKVPLGYVIWNIGNNMADGYPRRGEKFRLGMKFTSTAQAQKAMNALEDGTKTLKDFVNTFDTTPNLTRKQICECL